MCGISGVYLRDSVKEINHNMFEHAVKLLSHRGPEHCGIHQGPGIALGHTRLSIIDTSAAANQPFLLPDGSKIMVFNGEIFNYRQLAKSLTEKGVQLRTSSDTEVLLHLLSEHGIEALQQVKGFFAFAFYDKQKHELLLARDRYGEKPLFYHLDPQKGDLYFGSELKAVTPFVNNKEVNFDALKLLLQLTYIPAPLTIFKGVNKLEPGSFLRISRTGVQLEKYYHLPVKKASVTNEKEALEGIVQRVKTAVESRMVADVPVAGFLSGGIDSGIVSALAHRLNPAYETFSLGFSGEKVFDETADAEFTARHFGIRHHSVKLSENELLENVEEWLNTIDEPFGDSSAIALYSLCKMVKGKYKVVLSGDGADEVFGGYNKHYALMLSQQKNMYGSVVKNAGFLHHLLPKSRGSKWGNKGRQLEKMHRVFKKDAFERYWYLASFDHGFSDKLLRHGTTGSFKQALRKKVDPKDMNDYLRLDMELVLPGDMLYKVDMASMLNAVEVRSPFMDHELVEYAFSIDAGLKLKNGTQKYLLKTAFSDLLPAQMLQKPKHGFEVPLQKWLTGPLKHHVDRYLSPAFVREQQIFEADAVSLLLRKLNSSSPGDSAALVWTLLQFQKTWSDGYRTPYINA